MESKHPVTVPFDASALTAPVDRAAVRAFAAEMKSRTPSSMHKGVAIGLIGFVLAVFLSVSVFFSVITSMVSSTMRGFSAIPLVPVLLVVLLAVGGLAVFLLSRRRRQERQYRLDRFARANAMTYLPRLANPQLPGMIFRQGRARAARDLVRGSTPRFVEFANYSYTTGSGKNETTHTWAYIAVRLDVPLPHIVLDARGNNGLFGASNLPEGFSRDQRLALEGNFDQYFSLYCPRGYERDALYLFTPDIMARFIDNAAELDVEIVDDWLFLYAKRDFVTLDPATWAWLFSTVGALMVKLEQWARWRDERLRAEHPDASSATGDPTLPFAAPAGQLTPPPGVAHEGRRLRRGRSWLIVIPIFMAAVWLAMQFLP